jgi:O-acetyl-ADP-ribose deacetylase (regulator of RNase III)
MLGDVKMPLKIICGDIVTLNVDAIVNSANRTLRQGGGVDGKIHMAAGPELEAECLTLGGCQFGEAKITKAYRLPCKYVIHAAGPRWMGGKHNEETQLISCYQNSLALAEEYGCRTVAFPLISSGIYHYPKEEAVKIAVETILDFLQEHQMSVYIIIYDKESYQAVEKLYPNLICDMNP